MKRSKDKRCMPNIVRAHNDRSHPREQCNQSPKASTLFSAFNVATALAVTLLLSACDGSKKLEKPGDKGDKLGADGIFDATAAGLTVIDPRPRVSAFDLDELSFHVGGVRVGLQDYMTSESPAIAFFRPEQADYVEILRCSNTTIIRSGLYVLENVEIGTSSSAEQVAIMRSNDFWAVAEKQNGCLLVSSDLSAKQLFVDATAPSGGYRWIVRACVNSSRIDEDGLTSRNCTRQISISNELSDFRNKRDQSERRALASAQIEKDKMDGLGRVLYYTTVNYNNALAHCEVRESDRAKAVARKQAIANVIGQGVGFAANLYVTTSAFSGAAAGTAAQAGTDAAAKSGVLEKFGSMSLKEKTSAMWSAANTSGLAGDLGGQIAGALNTMFASENDLPRSCANAQKIHDEGLILKDQLRLANEQYASKMDAARIAMDNRILLENQ